MDADSCKRTVPAHWNLKEVPIKYVQRGRLFFVSEILQLIPYSFELLTLGFTAANAFGVCGLLYSCFST